MTIQGCAALVVAVYTGSMEVLPVDWSYRCAAGRTWKALVVVSAVKVTGNFCGLSRMRIFSTLSSQSSRENWGGGEEGYIRDNSG
jgi:hypothetical protein